MTEKNIYREGMKELREEGERWDGATDEERFVGQYIHTDENG